MNIAHPPHPSAPVRHVIHHFVADHFPTPWDIHCWCTQLTNKQPLPCKVLRNGKVLGLVCAEGAIAPRHITQTSGNLRFVRTEPAPAWAGQVGDIASISLRLSYTVSRRHPHGKKFTQSPWDTWGRLKENLKPHFLTYLEQHTGLTGLVDGYAEFGLQAIALLNPAERQRKVWLPSVADIAIRAPIAHAPTYHALAYHAIGNHCSYGMGSVACDLLETTWPQTDHSAPTAVPPFFPAHKPLLKNQTLSAT